MNYSLRSIALLAIAAFVAGLCFNAGYTAFALCGLDDQYRNQVARQKVLGSVPNPEGLKIEEVRTLASMDGLEITGNIKNSSEKEWLDPTVQVIIKVGNSQISDCKKEHTFSIRPSETQRFKVVCGQVKGTELPPSLSYTATVSNVWFERPKSK